MMEDVRRRMGEGGNKGWGRRGRDVLTFHLVISL